jgi:putative ABC transport system permease protein
MPDWTQHVRPRLSGLRLSPTREAEIVEELSQHLDDRYRELIAGGMSPEEATRVALSDFREGNVLADYIAPLRQARLRRSPRGLQDAICSAIYGKTCGTRCECYAKIQGLPLWW